MIDLDVSDLRALTAELARSPIKALPKLAASVQGSSRTLRDAYRADAQGHPHFPHFPNAITDETTARPGVIEGEVGPDKARKQGALGNILYFGSSKNAPVLDINGPMDAAEKTFEQAVADAVRGILS